MSQEQGLYYKLISDFLWLMYSMVNIYWSEQLHQRETENYLLDNTWLSERNQCLNPILLIFKILVLLIFIVWIFRIENLFLLIE